MLIILGAVCSSGTRRGRFRNACDYRIGIGIRSSRLWHKLLGVQQQPMHVVVIDTNILWSDQPFRDSIPWSNLLLYAGKYTTADFIVPEVVVHERARQESDRIARRRSAGAKALGEARAALASAGIDFPDAPTVRELRALTLESRHDLYHRMRRDLTEAGIHVAPIPAFPHETLVSWSLDAHPPFDTTDKGYRDALIWRTVRDVAAMRPHGTTILFATKDNDCTQKPGTVSGDAPDRVLHPNLATDLGAVTSNIVRVVRSLKEAVDLLDQPDHSRSSSAEQQVHEATNPERAQDRKTDGERPTDEDIEYEFTGIDEHPDRDELLRNNIESACDALIGEDIGSSYDGTGPKFEREIRDVKNATVTGVIPDLSTMSVDVHERFEGETLTGEVTVQAEVIYDGYVAKANAYDDDRPWTISAADWNEHYALVEGELQAELRYQFVLNGEDVTLEFDAADIYE